MRKKDVTVQRILAVTVPCAVLNRGPVLKNGSGRFGDFSGERPSWGLRKVCKAELQLKIAFVYTANATVPPIRSVVYLTVCFRVCRRVLVGGRVRTMEPYGPGSVTVSCLAILQSIIAPIISVFSLRIARSRSAHMAPCFLPAAMCLPATDYCADLLTRLP